MKRYLHGIHVAGHKSTAQMSAVKLPLPDSVVIPMAMHIGAPAKPVVKVGDYVKTGQLIGEPGGFVSAPIYASVSGTVKKIGEMLGSNGRMMQTVEIESDGLDARWEGIQPPKLETMQDFLDAVRASGLVGLGGAGFPTVVKLTVKNLDQIKCVIINGAECEPYITSDTRAMIDYSFDVIAGCRLLQKFLKVPRIVFGIEDNKPECIERYRELVSHEQNMEVMPLKAMYPQGGEKVLIYHVTGEKVPEGKLPLDVGAVVLNDDDLVHRKILQNRAAARQKVRDGRRLGGQEPHERAGPDRYADEGCI
ncbi:MAG: RnfABCDGE type electron transport complex subunit C [Oscillospiraceae bacterium]